MSTTANALPSLPSQLSQKRIFIYWLPLAASWLLMGIEGPLINGVMARISEAERMIAAFGIIFSISLVIESSAISMLPTSTALARTRQSYLTLRKFTVHLMLISTLLHFLVAWTPLFDLIVIQWIKTPATLIEPTRLGLQIMVFWSAAIAWRRFNQGILIRHGQTKYVGQGTILRLISITISALSLILIKNLPGVAVAGLALEVGVFTEAGFSHLIAQKIIQERFGEDVLQPNEHPLKYSELLKFLWPLAASNLIFLIARPLVSAALARGPNPMDDLTAWPVLSSFLFLTRSPTAALPELVIALHEEDEEKKSLLKFSLGAGLMLSGILAVIMITPLARFYFEDLIHLTARLAEVAISGLPIALVLPVIFAYLFYLRGLLTANRITLPITLAMGVDLVIMAIVLGVGVSLDIPGVPLAVASLAIGTGADIITLLAFSKHSKGNREQ